MGAVISRWRTKPTTVEQLENIDKDIKSLEEFRAKNQRLLKLWVGRLLLYSSALYLLTCLAVYCLYLPEQWSQRLFMALPFFCYPILVWFMRKLLIFLFSKRTERNNDKLEDLKVTKRKILEDVMETETYKNAKLILERFDPEAKKKAELEATPQRPQMTPRPGQEIRHRGAPMRPMGPIGMVMTPQPGGRPPMGAGGTPTGIPLSAPGGPPERTAMSASSPQGAVYRTPCSPIPGVGLHPPGPPLSRPILPRDRGAVDRVIEYLVGDGPQNRYALICQQCFSHNGMALKEEFEYLAFRCAYCYFLNPARKTRPQAPVLPEFSFERRLRAESPSPRHAPPSGADTEESAPPSGAKAPTPWSSVHSFTSTQTQQQPRPQIQLQHNPDEREMEQEEAGPTQEVENASQADDTQQATEDREVEVEVEEELVPKREEEEEEEEEHEPAQRAPSGQEGELQPPLSQAE